MPFLNSSSLPALKLCSVKICGSIVYFLSIVCYFVFEYTASIEEWTIVFSFETMYSLVIRSLANRNSFTFIVGGRGALLLRRSSPSWMLIKFSFFNDDFCFSYEIYLSRVVRSPCELPCLSTLCSSWVYCILFDASKFKWLGELPTELRDWLLLSTLRLTHTLCCSPSSAVCTGVFSSSSFERSLSLLACKQISKAVAFPLLISSTSMDLSDNFLAFTLLLWISTILLSKLPWLLSGRPSTFL